MQLRRRASLVLAGLLMALATPTSTHADLPTIDFANLAQQIRHYALLLKQYQTMVQQYEMLYDQVNAYYGGLRGFSMPYAVSTLANLVSGVGCPLTANWETAINFGKGVEKTAYLQSMLDAAYHGCLTDWPPAYRKLFTKTTLLDMANVDAIRAISASKNDQRMIDNALPGILDIVTSTGNKADHSLVGLLQKTAVTTATSNAQTRDVERNLQAVVHQLIVQNQVLRDQLQEALNYEAERRKSAYIVTAVFTQPMTHY